MQFLSLFSLVLSISVISTWIEPAPQTAFDPLEGLVAHYTFNRCDATDETGNSSNGILYGNPGCHCGVDDDGVFLDGVDDYIEFPGIVNRYFGTTDLTVSYYIKPGKYSIFKQSLLAKRETCDENYMLDFQLDINGKVIQTDFYETPLKYFKDISPETPDSDWIHIALVRRGIRAYTYINGQLRREGRRCSGVDITNDAVLSFSDSPCLKTGRIVRFKGGIDELRVYDRALTDKEVAALYAMYPVEQAEIDCVSFVPDFEVEGLGD